jgi:hypothetical protein
MKLINFDFLILILKPATPDFPFGLNLESYNNSKEGFWFMYMMPQTIKK